MPGETELRDCGQLLFVAVGVEVLRVVERVGTAGEQHMHDDARSEDVHTP